ncbi:MAG: pseudouridine synthase [Acidimicrobiales bacterium]
MAEPWVRFEDEHLLVVAKPAGVNTHRADVHAQDGLHEWVQRQRPDVSLSILHRLDKATSGLLVFGKSPSANRSLARQFEARTVAKHYELLVERDDHRPATMHCAEPIVPSDRRGQSGPDRAGREALTDFHRQATGTRFERYDAHPHTGRTHQVRVHATALGMPIVGDEEHGGIDAARLFLHAARLGIDHPTGGPLDLVADRPVSFDRVLAGRGPADPAIAALVAHEARALLFDPADTDAYLWIDRHHDGFESVRVERLGDVALALNYDDSEAPLPPTWLDAWNDTLELRAVYEQRRPRGGGGGPARRVSGAEQPRFEVTELGCRYLIDLEASSTSSGLFLDQRETRRRLLGGDLTGRTVLNAFAHTGSLSVAAARAGAETLTLDLSTRYLDWARDNLRANGIDPGDHDFIYGDALDWMARLARSGRTFDLVLVDPPSSSTTGRRSGRRGKRTGTRWLVERDLHELVERGARLGAPGGTLFVSTNLRRMRWARFLEHLDEGLAAAGRSGTIETQTLPLDHRSGPGDLPYLKAAWITLDAER